MAFSGLVFGLWLTGILNGAHSTDWDTDTIKAALATNSYTPNQDTHDYFDDVTNELSATGYTAGGVTLSGKSVTYTGATNKLVLDATDPAWTGLSGTFRHLIIYKSTGTGSTSPLIAVQSNDADISPGGTDFTAQLHADGAVLMTMA